MKSVYESNNKNDNNKNNFEEKRNEILNYYYHNNAEKLHTLVNKILLKFGGIYDKDIDDFYSIANGVFADLISKYDFDRPFENFLFSSIYDRIKSEITRRNRIKRIGERNAISIYAPVDDSEDFILEDLISSGENLEADVINIVCANERPAVLYLNSLSDIQREIVIMKVNNWDVQDIKNKLGLSDRQYRFNMKEITRYKRVKILYS